MIIKLIGKIIIKMIVFILYVKGVFRKCWNMFIGWYFSYLKCFLGYREKIL